MLTGWAGKHRIRLHTPFSKSNWFNQEVLEIEATNNALNRHRPCVGFCHYQHFENQRCDQLGFRLWKMANFDRRHRIASRGEKKRKKLGVVNITDENSIK